VILKEGRCVEDKLDAYFLLVNIFQAREEAENAYLTCLEVLTELGENAPEYCDGKDNAEMMEQTTKSLESKTLEDMMAITGDGGESAARSESIMKFYSFMSIVAFFVKPDVVLPICCRMVELSLTHGVTKFSAMGVIHYVSNIVQSGTNDITVLCKIGKLAIALLNQFESSDILARSYFVYYGFVAHYTDPIQSCDDMLEKGFQNGMSNGDTFSAFFCANHHIRLSLIGGANLQSLLRDTDYYLNIVGQHDNTVSKRYFLIFRETISTLINKGSPRKGNGEAESNETLCNIRHSETVNFHKALQSFWLGYAERSHHYVTKLLQISGCGRHHRYIITFYHGVASFSLLKRQRTSKLRQIPKEAIATLKTAAQYSKWNYGNKVYLLEAELASYEGRNEEAKSSYAAAILASRSSKFIHEQGLACELAGFHYKKIGDSRRAWGFFNQAKLCYAEWGSEMKVESIAQQLSMLGG